MTTLLYEAGAGTGKTYTITKEIAHAIAAGLPPESLLATTFTRKAAAELRDRIRKRILEPEAGDPELAPAARAAASAALEAAFIGTVHSVGFRMLARYALHLGLSPNLAPLEEAAQERHLRDVLAEMPNEPWEELAVVGRKLCQQDAQKLVLLLLQAKRTNRIPDADFTAQLAGSVEDYLRVMAPAGPNGRAASWKDLHDACLTAADALDRIVDDTNDTQAARQWLRMVARKQTKDWGLWGKAAGLPAGKRSGANDLLGPLRGLARGVLLNGELHDDLRAYVRLLAQQTVGLERQYSDYKQRHGLVDFTDQEDLFLRLLEDPVVEADLRGAIRLVVVDEFQDTNPIQLAIFERLRAIAATTIWVGDAKQAIYGFRGADDQLVDEAMVYADPLVDETLDAVPKAGRRKLEESWRSLPGLVEAVNGIFEPLMPGASLKPAAIDGKLARPGRAVIQRWIAPGNRNAEFFGALATKLAETAANKGYRGIAVLTRSHANAQSTAAELKYHGIPVILRTPGLLSTREGVAVLHALRYVTDDGDDVAAAHLRHLFETSGQTPQWLLDRLTKPEEWKSSPLLAALDAIPARAAGPAAILTETIQTLQIADRVGGWGEAARRCANLDALVELGWKYEEEAAQEGKAPTLTGLSAWLGARAADGKDLLPVPAGVDAVTISTIHAAKGLEWDTVLLVVKSGERSPDWWTIKVKGGNARAGKPLEGRTVRLWPYPFGINEGSPSNDGVGLGQAVMGTPYGQDLAERALAERRRLMYVAFTRARDRLILVHGRKEPSALEDLDAAATLPWDTQADLDADYAVLETLALDPAPTTIQQQEWFVAPVGPGQPIARFWSPSGAPAIPDVPTTAESLLAGALAPRVKAQDWETLGMAVHAYLAAWPSLAQLNEVRRVEYARQTLQRWGEEGTLMPDDLVTVAKRFEAWVAKSLPNGAWHPELPLTGPRESGGQWVGSADLVLSSAETNVLVDHKSANYKEAGWAAKAAEYTGQLQVYSTLIGNRTRRFIHLPLGGGMVEVGLP